MKTTEKDYVMDGDGYYDKVSIRYIADSIPASIFEIKKWARAFGFVSGGVTKTDMLTGHQFNALCILSDSLRDRSGDNQLEYVYISDIKTVDKAVKDVLENYYEE